VEAASGGTLFLDEVGDIPLTVQVKLLRLLESGTYRRVGSTDLRHADIRVISATHRDLAQMVAKGTFREDLYYRLSTFPIQLPALRERREDIALLSAALLQRMSPKRNLTLSATAQRLLQEQDFPGNVRELRNLLERTSLLCDGDTLDVRQLERALLSSVPRASPNRPGHSLPQAEVADVPGDKPIASKLKDAQRAALAKLVAAHDGSRAELAQHLGISPRSLYRKLKGLK